MEHRKFLKQLCKINQSYKPDDELAKKERFYTRIRSCTVNGKIGIIVDAMDCDCAQYSRGHIIDAKSPVAVDKAVCEIYDDAEGPMSVAVVLPEVAKKHKWTSRDLALEAYEDGHPHVVYY